MHGCSTRLCHTVQVVAVYLTADEVARSRVTVTVRMLLQDRVVQGWVLISQYVAAVSTLLQDREVQGWALIANVPVHA